MSETYRSNNGYFELTVDAAPAVAKWGEAVRLTLNIRNVSGAAIAKTLVEYDFGYRTRDGADGGYSGYLYVGDETSFVPEDRLKAIQWPNGATRTFSLTLDGFDRLDEPDWLNGHGLQPSTDWRGRVRGVRLTVYRNATEDCFEDVSGGFTCPAIVRERWLPAVAFSVRRGLGDGTPADEGERLLITARLGVSEHADTSRMACRLYYAQGAEATTESSYIDLTAMIGLPARVSDGVLELCGSGRVADGVLELPAPARVENGVLELPRLLLGGVEDDPTLVTQIFSNGVDWSFLMWFGDEYESASAAGSIIRAFANLHLSGASTGGAAFGRFSSSTEGSPKLESEYPFYPYGGIVGVTDYSTEEVATGGRWIDGRPIYRRTFVTAVAANAQKSVDIGADAALIVNWYGTLITGNRSMRPINWYNSATLYSQVYTYQGGTALVFVCREAGTAYCTIEYTKTSDPLP